MATSPASAGGATSGNSRARPAATSQHGEPRRADSAGHDQALAVARKRQHRDKIGLLHRLPAEFSLRAALDVDDPHNHLVANVEGPRHPPAVGRGGERKPSRQPVHLGVPQRQRLGGQATKVSPGRGVGRGQCSRLGHGVADQVQGLPPAARPAGLENDPGLVRQAGRECLTGLALLRVGPVLFSAHRPRRQHGGRPPTRTT